VKERVFELEEDEEMADLDNIRVCILQQADGLYRNGIRNIRNIRMVVANKIRVTSKINNIFTQ
jgi:hypothetical protein